MKVLLLCLALLVCYQAKNTPTGAEVLSLLQQDNTVDQVLTALQQWRDSTNEDINNLDASFAEHDPDLQAIVASAQDALDQKNAACDAIDATVTQGLQQAQNIQDNIQAAQDTITSNNQKSDAQKDSRCASNLLFVSELADKGQAIEFLSFLRGVVASPEFSDYINDQSSGALIQLRNALATKQENEILSLIAKHHMLSKLQVKQDSSSSSDSSDYTGDSNLDAELTASVRDSSEVGTDYVDNDRGAVDLDSVSDDYGDSASDIEQLLGYIDQLVSNLENDAVQLQQAETAAVISFIEYAQQLKDQNYVLNQYIVAANANLADVQATNENNQLSADQCREAVVPLQQSVQNAQDAEDAYEEDYNNKRETALGLVQLLEEAIQVYTDEVVNVATTAQKQRADDWLDNQDFDGSVGSASFDARTSIPNAPDASVSVDVGAY